MSAREYLADELEYMVNFEARSLLRSASSQSLNVHRTQLSTIGPSRCCPYLEQSAPTCHVRTLCLISEVASRLFFRDDPSRDSCRNFCSGCAMTVVILGHLNRSFYLLTYLLIYLLYTRQLFACLPVVNQDEYI